MPDAILFNFIPITSLLRGVPGRGFLSHAVNLYLRYKPPISDLWYFLDFQSHKIWAPIHNDLSLGPTGNNKILQTPALQFNLMGPKLYVNTTQVTSEKSPVTGVRLYLEGIKGNRLAIHLQHLVTPPLLLQRQRQSQLWWRSTQHITDSQHYFEAVQWKKFSHICIAPLSGCYVVQSSWMDRASDCHSIRSAFFSTISASSIRDRDPEQVIVDSGVYPTGPPAAQLQKKMLRFVDTSEICHGPSDNPGHWLVTGAKLDLDKGKICLRVKFSLLNFAS
ncbi:MACPF domain-containing protein [Striga hermonthica]|uniref:MACPF domain-containing protein n=1 Tax=Striga hermonthica TaxID=68872 RepID=A0A9N7MS46_STRHE|nr:MACPF domain-containing protein [Striga hermonthica]